MFLELQCPLRRWDQRYDGPSATGMWAIVLISSRGFINAAIAQRVCGLFKQDINLWQKKQWMEKDMECLPQGWWNASAPRRCRQRVSFRHSSQHSFAFGKKHLCGNVNVSCDSSDNYCLPEKGETRTGRHWWRCVTRRSAQWRQQLCLSDMVPLNINHLMKNPPTPSMLRVSPDHSILLIQGEAPVQCGL